MPLGIEGRGAYDLDLGRDFPEPIFIQTPVSHGMDGENRRLPAVPGQVAGEFERAQQSTTAALRREVEGDHEDVSEPHEELQESGALGVSRKYAD